MLDILSEKIKEIIIDLERKWPVDEWVINGVYVWPYVRIKIFINYFKPEKDYAADPGLNNQNNNYSFSLVVRKMIFPLKFLKALISLKRFFNNLQQKKLIFFGSHIHRSRHNEVYFNRFFDSMVDFHGLQDDGYIVEFQRVFEENYNQEAIIPLNKYLDRYKNVLKITSKLKKNNPRVQLYQYNKFLKELDEIYPDVGNLGISQKDLIKWTEKINNVKSFFLKMYDIIKPHKIIMASYYGFDDLSAAILAANEKGIKTVDFQHGPQINTNMAYNSWTKIPHKSYNIMPKEYWVWDEESKKSIDEWAYTTSGVSSRVVGQPYLSYWYYENKGNNHTKSYILYSLQPTVHNLQFEDFFPENLLNLIKSSSQIWIIRLHPRTNYNRDQILRLLTTFGIDKDKFVIEDSLEVPLPSSFSKAVLHITNWSGCLLEARMTGIPTIIIHSFGEKLYRDYIDNKKVYYLDLKGIDYKRKFRTYLKEVKNKRFKLEANIINPLEL